MRFPTRFQQRLPSPAFKPLARINWDHHASLSFTADDVPEEDVGTMLALASQAPSGFNLQPWRFVVVRDRIQRERLCGTAEQHTGLAEAPVIVVAYGRRETWNEFADEIFGATEPVAARDAGTVQRQQAEAREFIQSEKVDVWLNRHVMTAFSYLMLAAQALGWDTVPMEDFDSEAVGTVLNLPTDAEVVALLAIGRRRGESRDVFDRLPLNKLVCAERFGVPWSDPLDAC